MSEHPDDWTYEGGIRYEDKILGLAKLASGPRPRIATAYITEHRLEQDLTHRLQRMLRFNQGDTQ